MNGRAPTVWGCLATLAVWIGLVGPATARAGEWPASGLAAWVGCGPATDHSAEAQDQLMQLTQQVRRMLDATDATVAVVARSGTALGWLGHRWSHTGLALRDHPQGAWTVRQLYFDCEAGQSRLFDQGLAGFVTGVHPNQAAQLVLLVPPPEAAQPLARAALDDTQALALLGTAYSANAHAWDTRYQNCNQWVAELMATAWGGMQPPPRQPTPRPLAQQLLRQQGYQPSTVQPPWPPLVALAGLSPWLHLNDHPPEDVATGQLRVSMPASIEAWLHARWPATRRVALCQQGHEVVVHPGWDEPATAVRPDTHPDTCPALPGDERLTLAP